MVPVKPVGREAPGTAGNPAGSQRRHIPLADMTIPERRARFIEVLEEAERKQRPFDLTYWVSPMTPTERNPEPNICNTACCAVGLAMFDPALNAAGLKIAPTYTSDEPLSSEEAKNAIAEELKEGGKVGPSFFEPEFLGLKGVDAAAEFFGISYDQARRCFLLSGYREHPQITDVIARVKQAFEHHPV
jgi:hypothetical protein